VTPGSLWLWSIGYDDKLVLVTRGTALAMQDAFNTGVYDSQPLAERADELSAMLASPAPAADPPATDAPPARSADVRPLTPFAALAVEQAAERLMDAYRDMRPDGAPPRELELAMRLLHRLLGR
jgi:hypothetical protein